MLSLILATAILAPQGPGTSTAPVVINEFVYDDSGADDYEFVELYNRTNNPVDISLWTIQCNDPGSPPLGAGSVPIHTIPGGTILQPGGFYLLGSANIVPVPVPGVSQQWANNALENGNADTCELIDAAGNLVDEITYETADGAGVPFTLPLPAPNTASYTYPGERGIQGDLAVGNGPAASIARLLDGWDNNDNSTDFGLVVKPTPGFSNVQPSALPLLDIFDQGQTSVDITGWTGGWVSPKYVDPTVIDSQNFNPRPPSPQGGLAMSTWDASGGGNAVALDTAPASDIVIECYAYFEGPMAPASVPVLPYTTANNPQIANEFNGHDGEWWCVGVRGSIAANGNPPDVGTYWNDISPGVGTRWHSISGLCWAHFRTPGYSRLYLLDCKDGPTAGQFQNHDIIAGPIDIVTGVNDGWQRIRIHAQGEDVIGNFGGTWGFDNGQRFATTTTTTQIGTVYVGYREAVLYNTNGTAGCHPPHFDLLDVHAPTTTKTFIGTGSPTNTGTPQIDCDGLAIIGSTGFAIEASGLVPLGAPGYAFCGLQAGFAAFPAGIPIPGAPATLRSYLLPPALAVRLGFADANGNVRFPTLLPADVTLIGLPIVSQIGDFDLSMSFAIPVGATPALQTVIGN